MQWSYQQHKLKPKIIFNRSFLSYSLFVQVGGFRSTNRTVFMTAIPLESFQSFQGWILNRFKAISKNQHLHQLTLFRMGLLGLLTDRRRAVGRGVQKGSPYLKSVTHILQWWNLAQLYRTQRKSKKYMNHVTHYLSSADISIFSP